MARDPQVSCSLEEKRDKRDQAYIELIFSEVMKSDLFELIVDRNAHRLMQKLIVVLNEGQMTDFILSITTSDQRFLEICDHVYGTYVMQKLVREGSLTPMRKCFLVSTLKNVAGILSKTQHGHPVIMHCLARLSNDVTKIWLQTRVDVVCCSIALNMLGMENIRDGLMAEILANDLFLYAFRS
ncbi:hypothetical protein Dsin_024271 [Dipteronia sinensis]|uniref:Uncharacterized protein n=1 Tax=Dipteronia sinensis TaxID=43782 RepID=A0AAE0DW37_9ROSI|nr:hypothetical protein Dsin_024271 [Dipteronia sinensis]